MDCPSCSFRSRIVFDEGERRRGMPPRSRRGGARVCCRARHRLAAAEVAAPPRPRPRAAPPARSEETLPDLSNDGKSTLGVKDAVLGFAASIAPVGAAHRARRDHRALLQVEGGVEQVRCALCDARCQSPFLVFVIRYGSVHRLHVCRADGGNVEYGCVGPACSPGTSSSAQAFSRWATPACR